jgi:hypothetical protein
MMIVPEAANMPPTPWADRDLGAGHMSGGDTAHPAHAFLQGVYAGMHVGKLAAIGVERQFAAGGDVALGDGRPALASPNPKFSLRKRANA